MFVPPTPAQQLLRDTAFDFQSRHARPAAIPELMDALGVSRATIERRICALARQGCMIPHTRRESRESRPQLTVAQRKVLRILIDTRPRATMRQISRQLSIQVSAVHGHVVALERKGYVKRSGGRSRAIEVLKSDFSLPLAGKLVDGRFIPAGGT